MNRTDTISFELFAVLWNQRQGYTTPDIHFQMADWLQAASREQGSRLLLSAFRSSGKSTITGLFSAWLLYSNPDLRIIVLAADLALARKMVRNVKRIIERHPLTSHLKPHKADQWGSERFTVKRNLELRDPSMMAKGISTNITGSRADVVICDDVEVPNTCDTAHKRDDLRERLAEIDFVLVPGGMQIYVGTPHTFHTIYGDDVREELGEEQVFLHGFSRLKIPLLDGLNNSAWPERYSDADIERMRISSGPNKFASQMMLQPVNIAEGHLNPSLLKFYQTDIHMAKEINALFIGETRMLSASTWWDPAFGQIDDKRKRDASVLAVVFSDADGRYWLHRIEYLKVDNADDTDEATQQCRQIARIARELHLPSITLEINGIGRFLPSMLRNELASAKVPCAVVEISNSRPKDLRIMEAFDAPMAAGVLNVHSSARKTPFVREMQEWRPDKKNMDDDGLDAVAGALSLEPVRVRRLSSVSGIGHRWQGGGEVHMVDADFKV